MALTLRTKNNFGSRTGKNTLIYLVLGNMLLLSAGWIMAFYAYPRLPPKMPLWINFFGQQIMDTKKTFLFFIYPLAQTIFYLGFWRISKIKDEGNRLLGKFPPSSSERKLILLSNLKKEFVYLVLIFFNLIFIHLQRSIILLAHRIEQGISYYYFYSLFGIILILIPYYRIRTKLILKKQ